MTAADQALEQQLRSYWEHHERDDELASEIIGSALATPPERAATAARALQLMDEVAAADSGALQARIEEFRQHLDRLNLRRRQVDALGDLGTPPEALFEILEPDLGELPLDGFDGQVLRQARIGRGSRARAAEALLDAFGTDRLPAVLWGELKNAIDDLTSDERFQAKALFVDGDGRGFVLGLVLGLDPGLKHTWASTVSRAMQGQATVALDYVLAGQGTRSQLEWDLEYEGASIGLAAAVAALIVGRKVPGLEADPLLAATGELDVAGRIHPVSGIEAKMNAAAQHGIRRILLPSQNRDEAVAVAPDGVQLLFVQSVDEVPAALRQVAAGSELHYGGRIVFARSLLSAYRLELRSESELPHGHRLAVADGRSHANIDLFEGRKNSVHVSGPNGSAKTKADDLVQTHLLPPEQPSRPLDKYEVPTRALQDEIHRQLIAAGGVDLPPITHERWRVELQTDVDRTLVILWEKSGKLQISSTRDSGPADIVRRVLGALIEVDDEPAAERTPVNSGRPHVGTDEAGKGDYFGPLVCAAVYVDAELAERLAEIGVRDSKRLSDRAVGRIAAEIQRLARDRYAITRIGPRRFNQLLEEMRREKKNLNTLLAWGHTRSLEDLYGKGVRPEFVIVDQFADVSYIEGKLLPDIRASGVPIIQMTKAEADIAVAAASILARDAFLRALSRLSRDLGMPLPKGASQQVIDAGREIVRRHGAEKLGDVAKIGFATTEKVLAT